ncbi:hypothetical protein SOVF_130890 isoform B [Spinacia oleracea]|nr:hypothetical protein SOVF_130890 isoform B [Spinacia oleracea]
MSIVNPPLFEVRVGLKVLLRRQQLQGATVIMDPRMFFNLQHLLPLATSHHHVLEEHHPGLNREETLVQASPLCHNVQQPSIQTQKDELGNTQTRI